MRPGPKSKNEENSDSRRISVGWLKAQARVINLHLRRLKDGQPGFIAKIDRWPKGSQLMQSIDYIFFGRWLKQLRAEGAEVVVVGVVAPGKEGPAEELIRGKENFIFAPPYPAHPELWNQLKRARTVSEVEEATDHIAKMIPTAHWRALRSHAREFLSAKKLHHYPKSRRRPSSDDKRLQFIAKVWSGFMQDISPATATKRLSRLRLPNKDEIWDSLEEAALWSVSPRHRKKKMRQLIRVERETGSSQWWNVFKDETERVWREPWDSAESEAHKTEGAQDGR